MLTLIPKEFIKYTDYYKAGCSTHQESKSVHGKQLSENLSKNLSL